MSLFADLEPVAPRGVIGIGAKCTECSRPEPVMGKPGKGRPLNTFAEGYFCEGHAWRV